MVVDVFDVGFGPIVHSFGFFVVVFIPQTVLALRGSYLPSIVIPLEIAKAGRQVPKPRCLSPEFLKSSSLGA